MGRLGRKMYEEGQRLTVDNIKLPEGTNVFIAAGDTQTVDIDVPSARQQRQAAGRGCS